MHLLFYSKAQLLIQEKNFSRAEQMLYSVINTNSSHRDAYHQLAILYSQLNKTSEVSSDISTQITEYYSKKYLP